MRLVSSTRGVSIFIWGSALTVSSFKSIGDFGETEVEVGEDDELFPTTLSIEVTEVELVAVTSPTLVLEGEPFDEETSLRLSITFTKEYSNENDMSSWAWPNDPRSVCPV